MSEHRITETLLRQLAGDKYFSRGLEYARAGTVEIDIVREHGITATVQGTESYNVRLQWRDGKLGGDCDCPIGDGGEFCKHQVATALVWAGLAGVEDDGDTATKRPSGRNHRKLRAQTESDESVLRGWLTDMPQTALQTLVVELAGRDRDAWRELVARARFARAAPETLRKTVSALIGRRRFLDYRACLAYARRLTALTESLRELLARDPAAVLELADYALHRLFAIYEQSDDSSGALGEVLAELADLHRQAAKAAQPAPVAIAKAYFKLRQADGWSLIATVDAYLEALGSKGLATLEAQAQARLDALPPRTNGRHHGWDENESQRRMLQRLLEELARHGGDIDALLARKAQVINNAWDYLELARLCREHRRDRQAIAWLERGVKAFPDDLRLLDALADTRLREGFADEALQLRWRAFRQQPDETTYLALRQAAQTLNAWSDWRLRALAHVEQMAARNRWPGDDRRVGLMLAEGDLAEAWRIASNGRLGAHTWARLAPAIEATQPEGALHAYRTLVQASVEQTNKRGYRDAIAWLRRMRSLHQALDSQDAFAVYLTSVRETYRAKRNFIAMLDGFVVRRGS